MQNYFCCSTSVALRHVIFNVIAATYIVRTFPIGPQVNDMFHGSLFNVKVTCYGKLDFKQWPVLYTGNVVSRYRNGFQGFTLFFITYLHFHEYVIDHVST
jgi:hypothetical protein